MPSLARHVHRCAINLVWHITQKMSDNHNPPSTTPTRVELPAVYGLVLHTWSWVFIHVLVLFSVVTTTQWGVRYKSRVSPLGKRRCLHGSALEPNGSLHSVSLYKGTEVIVLTSSLTSTWSKSCHLCRAAAFLCHTARPLSYPATAIILKKLFSLQLVLSHPASNGLSKVVQLLMNKYIDL